MRLTWWRNLMITWRTIFREGMMRSKGENKIVFSWNMRSPIIVELMVWMRVFIFFENRI